MKNQRWIHADPMCGAPIFRREFYAEQAVSARLDICGLGFFQLYVNGKRTDSFECVPAVSQYHSILGCRTTYPVWEERSNFRTYYLTYDLLPFLREGKNVLGVRLGNGWYHQTQRTAEGHFLFGNPMLRYELTIYFANGSSLMIESDRETMWCESEVISNNLFYGEIHDLTRKEELEGWCLPDGSVSGWKSALPVHAPETRLMQQDFPPDRVVRTIEPMQIGMTKDGACIYDCGENITGWVQILCEGALGEEVLVQYSEELAEGERALDFSSTGGVDQIQQDRFRCGVRAHAVRPYFCWHGFRYFTVLGTAKPQYVAVVHTDVSVTSHFSSSNPVLNWIYDSYIRTQLNNFHGCVPSDCPHRERLGYTGDGQLTAEAALLTIDSVPLYRKWMEDILDSQGEESGHIPHTAPFLGGGGGPGGWGGAVFILPMLLYRMTGDLSVIRKSFPAILRWLGYMDSRSEHGLVVREESGGWCLGDWCTPPSMDPPSIPPEFVNTCFYIEGLQTAMEMAKLLGEEMPDFLAKTLKQTREAVTEAFFDSNTGSFCGGENGADAFAVRLCLGDERTADCLIEKYQRTQCLDTGIFGTMYLIRTLFALGEADLAFTLLTARTDASFARMMETGATTLWETWSGNASHNHPMFGAVTALLFTEILGIRQKEGTAGFSDVQICPADISALDWAHGSICTPIGTIYVSIKRDPNGKRSVEYKIEDNGALKYSG